MAAYLGTFGWAIRFLQISRTPMRETCPTHDYRLYYDTPNAVAYRCHNCGQIALNAAGSTPLNTLAALIADEQSEGRERARRRVK